MYKLSMHFAADDGDAVGKMISDHINRCYSRLRAIVQCGS